MDLEPQLHERLQAIRDRIGGLDAAVVAFSGGVDSTLLLRLAVDALGPRCLAVTAQSPSLAADERVEAERLARLIGARHRLVETHELQRPAYAANPPDRCYHCKSELFEVLRRIAEESGGARLLFGANADDLRDPHRPGQRAAQELGVLAPLAEAGLDKAQIRAASRALGLPTWNKPQLACLASRVPYGTPITAERLQRIDRAESAVRALGFVDVRVRDHGPVARLELGVEQLALLAEPARREAVAQAVRAAGYSVVAVDLEGFRSGRLNDLVAAAPRAGEVARGS